MGIQLFNKIDDISDEILWQTAILRWKKADEEREKILFSMRNWYNWPSQTLISYFNDKNELAGMIFSCCDAADSTRWYHGDLFVREDHRRNHIAECLIQNEIEYVRLNNGKKICAYLGLYNTPSTLLHEKLGFRKAEKFEGFNDFIFDETLQMLYEFYI